MARNTIIASTALGLGWIAVAATSFHLVGNPLPLPMLVTALSALITVSLLTGLVWLLTGPGFYRAMRLGEVIGVQRERCRAARASTPQETRVEVTTG